MHPRRHVRVAIAITGCALGLLLGSVSAFPAHAAPSQWYWAWSDGSRATTRVIDEDQHRSWEAVPRLRVASDPAAPGRLVELQVRTDGLWMTEDATRTDASGVAVLALNPYCGNGAWCDGHLHYRLRAAGGTARLTVDFTPSDASP